MKVCLINRLKERFFCYTYGEQSAPPLLLLNTLGMQQTILMPLAKALSEYRFVISIEYRGLNNPQESLNYSTLSIESLQEDMLLAMDHFSLYKPDVIAWCSGAFLVLEAIKNNKEFGNITFIAPSDISEQNYDTSFQKFFLPLLCRGATQDEDKISTTYNMVKSIISRSNSIDHSNTMNNRISSLSTYYVEAESTFQRYAYYNYCVMEYKHKVSDLIKTASQRCFICIIHAKDDEYIDVRGSINATEKLPNTKLVLIPKGGHYMLYNDPSTILNGCAINNIFVRHSLYDVTVAP